MVVQGPLEPRNNNREGFARRVAMIPVSRHLGSRPDEWVQPLTGTVQSAAGSGQRTAFERPIHGSLKAGRQPVKRRCRHNFQVTVQLHFLAEDQLAIRLGFDLTQISVHCMCRASKDAPCRATRDPDRGAFFKYIVHEVERALHKAVHWGLEIANNDPHKRNGPRERRGSRRRVSSRRVASDALGPAALS
jgi:hypothetical protein